MNRIRRLKLETKPPDWRQRLNFLNTYYYQHFSKGLFLIRLAATLHPQPYRLDFSKVCEHYLGLPGKVLCFFASILSLLGALVVYYVLICNFAFNIGSFINGEFNFFETTKLIN